MRRIEAERAQRQRRPDREQGEEGEVPEDGAEADAAQQLMVHHEAGAGLDGGDEGGPLCTRRRRGRFRQSENAGQRQGGAAGGQGVAPGRRQELGEQAGDEGRRQADDRARQLEACIGARQVGRRHQAGQQRDRRQHIDHGSRGAEEGGDAQQAHDAGGGRQHGEDRGRQAKAQRHDQQGAPLHAVDPGAGRQREQQPGCTLGGDQQAEHVRSRAQDQGRGQRQGCERQLVGGVGPGGGAEQGGEGLHGCRSMTGVGRSVIRQRPPIRLSCPGPRRTG